jgi:hypothetical protein
MRFLFLRAYWELVRFERFVAQNDFAALHGEVRKCGIREPCAREDRVERICAAVDMAGVWYWKQILCLQRSAATVCLLRASGVAAQLVIGAQRLPFKAHAWVEVDGRIVNDKPYLHEMYEELDRC